MGFGVRNFFFYFIFFLIFLFFIYNSYFLFSGGSRGTRAERGVDNEEGKLKVKFEDEIHVINDL